MSCYSCLSAWMLEGCRVKDFYLGGIIVGRFQCRKHTQRHVLMLELHRAESTTSLRESLYAGVDENGRKYHKYKEGSKYIETGYNMDRS